MKILLGHCFYRSSAPSGEDAVYRNEKALLEERMDVIPLELQNDDIDHASLAGKVKVAFQGIWSKQSYHQVSQTIKKTKPDIAHFHNTFPQLSPSVFAACYDNHVPVIVTLHNYRFICPNALLLRDSKVCEECLSGSLFPAMKYRCYRGSTLATGAQCLTIATNKRLGSYDKVTRYIALTNFAREKFIQGGLAANKLVVKPNFLPVVPELGCGEGGYIVYVGRLSEEKGVHNLVAACREVPGLKLKILGDGPMRSELEAFAKRNALPIDFMGFCDKETILEVVSNAMLQVIPSIWYEGFPMVALEAMACGTPLLVSKLGSLEEIVDPGKTGFYTEPGSVPDLVTNLREAIQRKDLLKTMRIESRRKFLERYTRDVNLQELTAIYENAIRSK